LGVVADYVLPSLGADMEAATVVEWQIKPGDTVRKGQIVGVVETEKAAMDIEFFGDGVIEELLVPIGTNVAVGTPLVRYRPIGPTRAGRAASPVAEVAVAAKPAATVAPGPAAARESLLVPPRAAGAPRISPSVRRLARVLGVDLAHVRVADPGGRMTRDDVRAAAGEGPRAAPARVLASPRARRLAEQSGVDLTKVVGTGPGGSVTVGDVEAATVTRATAPPPPAIGAPPSPGPTTAAMEISASAAERAAQRQAAMREAIGALMARSKREIPHYYLSQAIDCQAALAWLEAENLQRSMERRLLPAALLIKAVALAVNEVPEMNGYWVSDHFEASPAVHAGIAISLRGGGLVAPAIHDAASKTLDELMAGLRDLVTRARGGILHRAEMAEPTITITNLGEQGADEVFGVIYPPQVALVGFGRIGPRPWAADGMVGVRPVVTVSLSVDHRVSDGHRGGRFLAGIDRRLQHPEKL
jgi:pyruvate dehydrogenase E2 component (dihydrolipoamide acetyltransferase)